MSEVTEQQISDLVRVFYGRARQDTALAPVFDAVVENWEQHLQIVEDFWSHVLLGTKRYQGSPYPVHANMPIPIERPHFAIWLDLFRQTALETLPPEAAATAIGRAEHMTKSFKAGLFPFDRD